MMWIIIESPNTLEEYTCIYIFKMKCININNQLRNKKEQRFFNITFFLSSIFSVILCSKWDTKRASKVTCQQWKPSLIITARTPGRSLQGHVTIIAHTVFWWSSGWRLDASHRVRIEILLRAMSDEDPNGVWKEIGPPAVGQWPWLLEAEHEVAKW